MNSFTGSMRLDVQGVLRYCRCTNNRRVLEGTFPDIPAHLITALMEGEAELSDRPEGVYVIPLHEELA